MGIETRANDERAGRRGTPERTCAVTREVAPPADLIRFVQSPDGVVVPDVAGRLPGRGVWVTADRGILAQAVSGKAFARSLRESVTVPDDLVAQVDRLLERRVVDGLALANKAGLVTSGFTRTEAAILSGEVAILLHASDGAADGAQKLDRLYFAISRDIGRTPVVVRLLDVMQISLAIGRSNVVHAALKSGGAAARFLQEARRLVRFRQLPAEDIGRNSPEPEGTGTHSQVGPTGKV